jgi:hypothetical protein
VGRLRWVLVGMIFGIAPMGCAAVSWHYYGLDMPAECYEKGSLIGPKPAQDLPLTTCEPDASDKGKCGVLLREELMRLIQDDKQCHIDLQGCQSAKQ